MRTRVRGVAVLVAALTSALAGITPGQATASAGPASGPASAPASPANPVEQKAGPRTLTLITGDRVVTESSGQTRTAPREGVQFLKYGDPKQHQYLIPSDALPLLRDDRLDLRLFDIAQLLADDYDRRDTLPLIVSDATSVPTLKAQQKLGAIDGFATEVPTKDLADQWQALRSTTKGKIWLDGMSRPALDVSVPAVGAATAWAAGLDGTGVTVALLDSGVDDTHADLAGKVSVHKNFVDGEDGLDYAGHGTHVASTIVGSGAASAGKNRGVAPGATLIEGKVCGGAGYCQNSSILAGMQWAVDSGAKIVNMSLGGEDKPGLDPMEQAVNDLSAEHGTLFVVAAGNDGPHTLGSPASADAALSVANFDGTELSYDSSTGPRIEDHALKPDIGAPGTAINAAQSSKALDTERFPPGGLYVELSGTSMATPHVTGAAAILLQQHPDWTGPQLKTALMNSAEPEAAVNVFGQGSGHLNIGRGIAQTVTASPASLSLGYSDYPHTDDEVINRKIEYNNAGTEAVTFALKVDTTAPAGIFTLSATSVTVPAGGTTSVDLITDTRNGGDVSGEIGGHVVAAGGGKQVVTPFGIIRQETISKVHIVSKARTAATPTTSLVVLYNIDDFTAAYYTFDADTTLSVQEGRYYVFSYAKEADGTSTMLTYPVLDLTKDAEVVMDGRKARPFDVTVPDKKAVSGTAYVNVTLRTEADHYLGYGLQGKSFAELYTAHLGPKDVPGLYSQTGATYAAQDAAGSFVNSPFSYDVGWYQRGTSYTGLTKHLTKRDFSTIKTTYGINAPGSSGFRTHYATVPGEYSGHGAAVQFALPAHRTEYLAGNATWDSRFIEAVPEGEYFYSTVSFDTPLKTYTAGRTYEQEWNKGVFATGLAAGTHQLGRHMDGIFSYPGLYTDPEGHDGWADTRTKLYKRLYRNGEYFGESDWSFYVPDEMADYRIIVGAEYGAPTRFSTKVEGEWSFSSKFEDLPLRAAVYAIAFDPELDDYNSARHGSWARMPIIMTPQSGTTPPKIKKVTAEVSYDDGATWSKADVDCGKGGWELELRHPNKVGFVSLRATATDAKGTQAKVTVIRAYELR